MRLTLRTVLLAASVVLIVSGVPVWAHTDVTPAEARELIDSTPDLLVVDVREPFEYCDARGHIPGAVNYPLSSGVLQARCEELPMDRPILVVCRSGGRSNVAANFLDAQGFLEVYDMNGGMNAWLGDTVPCKYAGGSGTAADPYQIATAADLIALGADPNDYDKHFILTADIDLDPNLPGRRVYDAPVIPSFSGFFDGEGHRISNFTFQGTGIFLGLFGRLRSPAVVSNLGLHDVDFTVEAYSDGAGGLAGFNEGCIISSYSTGEFHGGFFLGGLVGLNGGSITASYSTGTFLARYEVGGLVGRNSGSVTMSHSTGVVGGEGTVGGLAGTNAGSIATSHSTGEVSGEFDVGGLVGLNWSPGNHSGSIAASYSSSEVTGGWRVGGLVGHNEGGITASYSTGAVGGGWDVGGWHNPMEIPTNWAIGGLVGDNFVGSVVASFWDTETSGQTVSGGGTGLTTARMQDATVFLSEGWDFVDEIGNGTCDYWQVSPGDYPRLRSSASDSVGMPAGSGTLEDPYLIQDARDLGAIWLKPSAHYRMEASLDLAGIAWSMPVVPWFGGTFDGNGHAITNLHIDGRGDVGLFGYLGSEAMVYDLGLEDVNLNGTGGYVGALAAENRGAITTSYSTGSIIGEYGVGGLVGFNSYGSISSSYSTADLSGDGEIGGLVGENRGDIATSYSAGEISGSWARDGVVGWNTGSITACFWDLEASGQASYRIRPRLQTLSFDGARELSTEEMFRAATFLDAGWDFVGEAENGTEDIWWIDEGQDYPRLWWEAAEAEF